MADAPIPQGHNDWVASLPEASTITVADTQVVVQGATSKRTNVLGAIAAYLASGISALFSSYTTQAKVLTPVAGVCTVSLDGSVYKLDAPTEAITGWVFTLPVDGQIGACRVDFRQGATPVAVAFPSTCWTNGYFMFVAMTANSRTTLHFSNDCYNNIDGYSEERVVPS
jgi:hypothetical protein